MSNEEILKALAPCGLNCQKCLSHFEGNIKLTSARLQELMGNFDRYAERFSAFMPVFKNYPQFKEFLDFLTEGKCQGCRTGLCVNTYCRIPGCVKEKAVDFCFQCQEFPCENTGLNTDLHQRWINMNQRMREIGIEKFYKESKSLPRYR